MDKGASILITGATGFIGRYLVEELLKQGYNNIYCIVRKTSNIDFLKENNLKLIYVDIIDKDSLENLSLKPEIIFHCAGYVRNRDKNRLWQINVYGTKNVCEFAYKREVKKFIYLSSVAVNSRNKDIPLTEDMPYGATNLYGESKLGAEKVVLNYLNKGLPTVIVRPCMVYGKDEPHLLPLIKNLMKKRLLFLPNEGKTKLHLVSVRNVTKFLVCCLERKEAEGQVFNIADNEVLTTKEIFSILSKVWNLKEPYLISDKITSILKYFPFLGRKIRFLCKDRVYSIQKAKSILGFVPSYSAYKELTLV